MSTFRYYLFLYNERQHLMFKHKNRLNYLIFLIRNIAEVR